MPGKILVYLHGDQSGTADMHQELFQRSLQGAFDVTYVNNRGDVTTIGEFGADIINDRFDLIIKCVLSPTDESKEKNLFTDIFLFVKNLALKNPLKKDRLLLFSYAPPDFFQLCQQGEKTYVDGVEIMFPNYSPQQLVKAITRKIEDIKNAPKPPLRLLDGSKPPVEPRDDSATVEARPIGKVLGYNSHRRLPRP